MWLVFFLENQSRFIEIIGDSQYNIFRFQNSSGSLKYQRDEQEASKKTTKFRNHEKIHSERGGSYLNSIRFQGKHSAPTELGELIKNGCTVIFTKFWFGSRPWQTRNISLWESTHTASIIHKNAGILKPPWHTFSNRTFLIFNIFSKLLKIWKLQIKLYKKHLGREWFLASRTYENFTAKNVW